MVLIKNIHFKINELSTTTFFLFLTLALLNKIELLSLINIFFATLIACMVCRSFNLNYIYNHLKTTLLTAALMCWSVSILPYNYKVYAFDWSIFSIPINLIFNSDLYVNDLLAKQEYPHVYIYKLVAFFIELNLLNELFFFGFILQNFLIVKSFQVYYKLYFKNSKNLNSALLLIFPLYLIPQTSGHYTVLPWFLPSILGYSLVIYLITNFIFLEKNKYNFLLLILLIFIHPFWGLFLPLYLFLIFLITKGIQFKSTLPFAITFVLSIFLSTDGVSLKNTLNSDWINFAKEVTPIHHSWNSYKGFFENGLNNYIYQSLPLLIFLFLLLYKKKLLSFNTKEETLYSSIGIICLVIILGNVFSNSILNDILVATNFFRIGSLTWFFIGIFIYRQKLNKFFEILFLAFPYFIYLINNEPIFVKFIRLFPSFGISSNFTYFFLFQATYFFLLKKNKYSVITCIIGIIYFLIFFYVDKIEISNYLLFSTLLSLFLILYFWKLLLKFKINSNILIVVLPLLFFILTFDLKNIYSSFEYNYKTFISEESLIIIKYHTDNNSVILIDPNSSYFRQETQRGVLFSYNLIPYNIDGAKLYNNYSSYFNNKKFEDLDVKELNFIIKNTNVTDMILPENNRSNDYFKKIFEYYYLPDLGYLYIDIKNST